MYVTNDKVFYILLNNVHDTSLNNSLYEFSISSYKEFIQIAKAYLLLWHFFNF